VGTGKLPGMQPVSRAHPHLRGHAPSFMGSVHPLGANLRDETCGSQQRPLRS
jgi:hypothetical protein